MTQAAYNYGRVLFELKVPETAVKQTKEAFGSTPELRKALKSPVVAKVQKHRVIDRVFPPEMRSFLKVLCDHQDVEYVDEISEAYHGCVCEQNGILTAELSDVTEPDEEQLVQLRQALCEKYGKKDVEFRMTKDSGLVGGFLIRVGDMETDWSLKGRLKTLEQKLTRR